MGMGRRARIVSWMGVRALMKADGIVVGGVEVGTGWQVLWVWTTGKQNGADKWCEAPLTMKEQQMDCERGYVVKKCLISEGEAGTC